MPYDLSFKRIIQTDNQSALESNKLLANVLIAAFPEINDLNATNSSAHFSQFEIDPEDEFLERHFRLWAKLNEMNFGFEFWRDTLWIELGAAGNPNVRFEHVRRYSELIVQHGFALSNVSDSEIIALEKGIEEHLQEYKEWTGFVRHVVYTIHSEPPATQ
ncbi:MAG: hypothetical protein EOO37_00565 [Cytophagaceae bacterium]|nr:MAG: hypothetical protein EOO37_00565 [Cytophagaceae bacterium]